MYSITSKPYMKEGTGAIIPVRFFHDDPQLDRDLAPFRSTHAIATVPSLDALTPEIINAAVAKRAAEVKDEELNKQAAASELPAQVRDMIGRSVPHGRTEVMKKGQK